MAVMVLIGICAAAVAFLVYFEVALFRESKRPFVMYRVEYHKAYVDSPTEELDSEEPLAEPEPAA